MTLALELTQGPCQAPDCCETDYLKAVHSVQLKGEHLATGCASVPPLDAVAPLDRPRYLEQAITGGTYRDLDEGTFSLWVIGYDDAACSKGREVLCGQSSIELPPPWNKVAVPLYCKPDHSAARDRSLAACIASSDGALAQ